MISKSGLLCLPLAAVIAAIIAGCGAGSSTGKTTISPQNGKGAGTVRFQIKWPAKGATRRTAQGRVIPVSAQSIDILIQDAGGNQLAHQLFVRPSTVQATGSLNITNIAAGSVRVNARAFPNADGSGVLQAQGFVDVTVIANQSATASLAMGSTVTQVQVIPFSTTLQVGSFEFLAAQALDSGSNVVMTDPTDWGWGVDTGTYGSYAAFNASGNLCKVTGVAPGPYVVNAFFSGTDSSQSSVTGSVTLTITPSATASAIFIADSGNDRILGLDKILSPTVMTLTGFTNLNDLSVDRKNNLLYAVDSSRIVQMDFAGNLKHSFTPTNIPLLVHVGADGTVYYYDQNFQLNKMSNFASDHVDKSVGSATHPFNGPMSIATDTGGYVYVSDSNLNTIYRFDPNLTTGDGLATYGSSAIFNLAAGLQLHDLAIDSANKVYVADTLNNRVVRFDANAFNDPSTANLRSCVIPASTPGLHFFPLSIAVDSALPNPHIYITGFESATYSLFSPNNVFVVKMDDMILTNLQRFGGPRGGGANQMAIPLAIGVR